MSSKPKIHPGVLAAVVGGLLAVALSQFWLNPPIKPTQNQSPPVVETEPKAPAQTQAAQTQMPSQAIANPQPVSGGLRVKNQTPFPIRLVLLTQPTPSQSTATAPADQEPVHWDFAPEEGSDAGLIMSLPEGDLRLQPADILVGFAVDGSRRYWGPYVVGETASPQKQPKSGEWQLTLRP